MTNALCRCRGLAVAVFATGLVAVAALRSAAAEPASQPAAPPGDSSNAAGPAQGGPSSAERAPEIVRELFVPFEDLNVLLENQPQRVLLSRQEYEDLLAKAAVSEDKPAPRQTAVLSADYAVQMEPRRAVIRGEVVVEVMAEGLHAVRMDLSGVGLRSATLADRPAVLGQAGSGKVDLFVEGAGTHRLLLEMVAPVETTAARQSLQVHLPEASAASMELSVPGDVDLQSGADVVSRGYDADSDATRFRLSIPRGPLSLVMTLNSRQQRQQRAVVARSVMVDEITRGYERLHVTVSLEVLHQTVERFRFAVPADFEVTHVESPLLSRWSIDDSGEGRVVELRLREPTEETVVVNMSAVRPARLGVAWELALFKPLDVVGEVAVVGLLVEDRLRTESIAYERLIPIDTSVLRDALPETLAEAGPNAPTLEQVAAFYAPQAEPALTARFVEPPAELAVTSNALLIVEDGGHELRAGFSLLPKVEKLFNVEVALPAAWEVTRVTGPNEEELPVERFTDEGRARLVVRLPGGVSPGQQYQLYVQARAVPEGWLNEWDSQAVTFPRLVVRGATRDEGAVAVEARGDFTVRPAALENLTPLDEAEKGQYGLGGVVTDLAYRYAAQPYRAELTVQREQPRITARTFSFFRIKPGSLEAHYEIVYSIEQAAARSLELELPEDTPAVLSIRGAGDLGLKEYTSTVDDGMRRWHVDLEEARRGDVRLLVDFSRAASADKARDLSLPLVRATGVGYQSGLVAVEGSAELDVQVKSKARRVDVGELVDAEYQPGRRLLGVFGFVGKPPEVAATVLRHPGYPLPATIVQQARLTTLLASEGTAQTAADFVLRSGAVFVEVQLPGGSTLWAADLDDEPIKPQRKDNALLVSLPAAEAAAVRSLRIVYETPVDSAQVWGQVDLPAPRLKLRAEKESAGYDVPLADLHWDVFLPDGYRIVRSRGTVVTEQVEPVEPAAVAMLRSLYWIGGGVHGPLFLLPAVQSAREAARRSSSRQKDVAPTSEGYLAGAEFYDGDAAPAGGPAAGEDSAVETDEALPSPPEQPMEPEPQMEEAEEEKPAETEARSRSEERKKDRKAAEGLEEAGAAPGDRPAATTAPAKPRSAEAARQARKAELARRLRGLASLKIDVRRADFWQRPTTFCSLGEAPRLQLTVASRPRLKALGWALAGVVLLAGLAITRCSARAKIRFLLLLVLLATLVPLVPGLIWLAAPCNMAVYAASALVPYYFVAALVRWLVGAWQGSSSANDENAQAGSKSAGASATAGGAASVLFCLFLVAQADPLVAAEPQAKVGPFVIQVEQPPEPVDVPEDAILIPYDAEGKGDWGDIDRRLIPYKKYVELWNRAYPDEKLDATPLPARFTLSASDYRTRLADDQGLLVEGRLTIDVFDDEPVMVPLPLSGGLLVDATVDGEPARLGTMRVGQIDKPATNRPDAAPAAGNRQVATGNQAMMQQTAQQPPGPQAATQQARVPNPPGHPVGADVLVVHLSGKGRHVLELSVRLEIERQGGWRKADARLPAAAAAGLSIVVPEPQTEVQLGDVHDRRTYETEEAGQTIETALATPGGRLGIHWRPKVAETEIDRGLTTHAEAVFDLQEAGLHARWQLQLAFPRGQRESFRLTAPADYLVEEVSGVNVRGFEVTATDDGQQIDVELLEPARDSQTLTVRLWHQRPLAEAEGLGVDVPSVRVDGAALEKGRVLLRRSPLLSVEVDEARGVSRTDVPVPQQGSGSGDAADGVASPLGLLPYQAYHFAGLPFSIRLSVEAIRPKVTASLHTVLRLSDRGASVETRAVFDVQHRPVYRAAVLVPAGFALEEVSAPGAFHHALTEEDDGRQRMSVFFERGQLGRTSVVFRGRIEGDEGSASEVPLPRIAAAGVDWQEGYIAVQVDPAVDVSAVDLNKCETVLLQRLHGWLEPKQRGATKLAIRYHEPDYSGMLRLTPRKPLVHCATVSNVRITDRAIEETVLLDFTIHRAGIRRLAFLLPRRMAEARIRVPMLRQKTVEPLGEEKDGPVRVVLELQDEMMNQLRVLIEHDRLLTAGAHRVPIPKVETGTTQRRFVTIESAGRDEVVIQKHEGLEPVVRQQKDWRWLQSMLGGQVTRAYLAVPGAENIGMQYTTKERQLVETAGARIGLAEADIVVDANGAYRGAQIYHLGNSTEQFLQVELPHGARLWTAQVAGEPVKPVKDPDAADRRHLRIPLVKTAAGDLDYEVVLKYGGSMPMPSVAGQTAFPLVRTLNINVEMSQVRLHLPEEYRWFDFGGTMRPVDEDADLVAGYMAYQNRLAKRLIDTMRHAGSFAKIRAASKLKGLKSKMDSYQQDSAREFRANEALQEEIQKGSQMLSQAGEEITIQLEQPAEEQADVGNRDRLKGAFRSQSTGRARNVVEQLEFNFKAPEAAHGKAGQSEMRFDNRWLKTNQLADEETAAKEQVQSRLREGQKKPAGKTKAPAPANRPAVPEVAKGKARASLEQAQGAFKGQQADVPGQADGQNAVMRYQRKLQQEAQMAEPAAQPQRQRERGQPPADDSRPSGEGRDPSSAMQPPVDDAAGLAGRGDPFGPGSEAAGETLGRVEDLDRLEKEQLPADRGLSSLDVQFPERGVVYRFATPRGDVRITARGFSGRVLDTAKRLAALGVVLLIAAVLVRGGTRAQRHDMENSRFGAWLIAGGLIALLLGMFPVAAILAIVAGGVVKLRRRK